MRQFCAWTSTPALRSVRMLAGVCALLLTPWGAQAASDSEMRASAVKAEAVTTGANCGSLVIRDCRLRTPSVVVDSSQHVLAGAPRQWEAVHEAGPDSEEIFVTGERIRGPTPSQVFDRYLGSPQGSTSLISRDAVGGARCTTISRSAGVLCSSSGDVYPGMGTPVTSWSFSF